MKHAYRCLRVFTAALALPVSGCKLVDQTSFGGTPRAPAPAELAVALASHGGAPLLVIRPAEGVPYGDELRRVIDAAEHQGIGKFRLDSVVPAQGDVAASASAMSSNEAAARQVLDDMGQDGITPDRVTLTAQTDAHLTAAELRLFQD